MNPGSAVTARASNTETLLPGKARTRLFGLWLLVARVGWLALVALEIAALIVRFPTFVAKLYTVSDNHFYVPWQLSPESSRLLQDAGISLSVYAPFAISLACAIALVWVVMGVVIFWRKSDDWMVLLAAFLLIVWGVGDIDFVPTIPSNFLWALAEQWSGFFLMATLILFYFLFPDGRFVPGWTRWLAIVFIALEGGVPIFFPDSPLNPDTWPPPFSVLSTIIFFGSMAAAQMYRYRRVANSVEREQIKWVVFALTIYALGLIGVGVPDLLNLHLPVLLAQFLGPVTSNLVSVIIPISIGIAILRYRLWDIDVIINRTLVYGTLTVSIVALYALVVVGLGALLQSRGTLLISLLTTGLIAVLFQPLRVRLQRAINRLMYGDRDEPYKVISRLGQRLEATLAPDAVLPTIVETVAQALKLPYAAIALMQEGEMVMAAAYGVPKEYLIHLPLVYQSKQLGEITLAPRGPSEGFTPADRALLEDLARQTGVVVHTVRLTTDLQCLTGELQSSRTQLVTMREEERRRLRRDLHDGLGSALTSMTFQLDAASNVLERDPQAARTLLADLKRQTQAAIADIRRLVYNLRPPILDEWGLVAALHEQVAQYQLNHVQVCVEAPESLPPLPAAVEVAAYRIALEALANVVRHAHASSCSMRLALSDEVLTVEVRDDGEGLPEGYHAGVGISAMRERAAELGGSCAIETIISGGTRVSARLPLQKGGGSADVD